MALQVIPTPAEQQQVLAIVQETLESTEAECLPPFSFGIDFSDWTEGVEEFAHLTIREIARSFGLPLKSQEDDQPNLPFFNDEIDIEGSARPWETRKEVKASTRKAAAIATVRRAAQPILIRLLPHWHQWVGIKKMINNMAEHKNVLLMDSVGVGKTMQATGTIAMYDWLRMFKKRHSRFLPDYG